MTTELSNSARLAACIERINEMWELHKPYPEPYEGAILCLAFAISSQYVEAEGIEWRLGVSYGGNPCPPELAPSPHLERERPFVMWPDQPGKFIFGIHVIGTQGNKISIFDNWYDSRKAEDNLTSEQALQVANIILEGIPDSYYAKHAAPGRKDDHHEVKRSSKLLLEDLEVMFGEGFETEEERQAIKDSASSDYDKRWMAFFTPYSEKFANSHKKS